MPSSTSSSNLLPRTEAKTRIRFQAWIVYSLLCLVCFYILVEMLTRVGFTRISRLESRTAQEHKAALSVKPSSGLPSILLVGNSLPLEGIDVPQLQTALAGKANIARFVIEQTRYVDWYYGIRRLLAEGSKPDIVILCIDISNLTSSQIRGDYSAFYLFQARDIPNVGRDIDYDLTKTSSLFFAHYSLFYAGRTSLRNFLLNRIDPPYANLLHNLGNAQEGSAPRGNVYNLATQRLAGLRQLCAEHGSQFIFLLPPGHDNAEQELVSAGQQSSTTVMIPIHLNAFGPEKFRDGYHLNTAGAQIFTTQLIHQLNSYLGLHPRQ